MRQKAGNGLRGWALIALALMFAITIDVAIALQPNTSYAAEGESAALAVGSLTSDSDSALVAEQSTTAAKSKASSTSSKASSAAKSTKYKVIYRVYNPYSGEHFYTASKRERNKLVKLGWRYEGPAWMAPTSGKDVYRLYNRYTKDHFYTTDANERNKLRKRGWRSEGVCWRSSLASDSSRVPIYRQFNPFAKSGTHNYTLSKSEKSQLVKMKWRSEGVAWYGRKVKASFKDDMEVWEPGVSGDDDLDAQIESILKTHTDLSSCFSYVVGFSYISGNRFYSNPRILPDSTTIAYAKEMLANHGGNCYRFACLFCWLARGLGYSANVVSGWVPSASGGAAPHGWVEIYQNGGTYIYDPDLAHELSGYNWFGTTYASAPLVYGSW